MGTLQDRIYAEKWFSLAVSEDKLAYFVIGMPPYAEHRPEDAAPVLVPNVEVLYDHHAENPGAHFDTDVENAVLQIVEDQGDDAQVILHALVFIVTQLAYEKRGAAKFALDHKKLLDAIRQKVMKNKNQFSKKSGNEDVWGSIEYYDRFLRGEYGLRLL